MADTTVDSAPSTLLDSGPQLYGPYWISPLIGIIVFVDSSYQLSFTRTTDGGGTWNKTVIESGGSTAWVSSWFDQETPGDSGTLVHIGWLNDDTSSAYYVNVDISDGAVGTIRTVDSGITVSSSVNTNRIAITKTVSGNIIYALSTQTEIECYKSDDLFATAGTAITDPFETATEEDWVLLYPAATADDNDACCIFWDRSALALSVKMYDDSADSWTETSIRASTASPTFINMDAAVRHSDGHILLVNHTLGDFTTDDLLTWDITPDSIAAPTVTAKTNIFTDQVESAQVSVIINQQNDDIYVAYLKGGTWQSATDVVFHKSDDGMATWGSESAYNETTDDNRLVHGGRTIGDSGGRIQWSWFNDDLNDIFVNLVNDIEITAAAESTTVLPSTLTMTSAALEVTLDLITNITLLPSTLTMTSVPLEVTVTTTGDQIEIPDTFTMTAAVLDPTIDISLNNTVFPGTVELTSAVLSPTIFTSLHVTVLPTTLELTSSILTPQITLFGDSVESTSIDFNNGTITTAKITATFSSGSEDLIQMTADGTKWDNVTNGVVHTFVTPGTDLRWKIFGQSAVLTNVTVEDYH